MTVMSEGLLLNSKYIKMGCEAVHSRKNLFYSLVSSAHSLKCYTCQAGSAEECSATQNVTTCDDRLRCGILTYDDHGFQYIKDCLWASYCDVRKDLTNCTIQVCKEDYCNGSPPPTTAVKPSAACTGSSETPTTKLRVTKTAAPPIVLENNTAPLTKVSIPRLQLLP